MFVITQTTDQQVTGGVVFGVCFTDGIHVSSLIDLSVRCDEIMIGHIGPVAVGAHSPGLDALYLSYGIIGGEEFGAFMMHRDANGHMSGKWPWFHRFPFRTGDDADQVIDGRCFFAGGTGGNRGNEQEEKNFLNQPVVKHVCYCMGEVSLNSDIVPAEG